MPERGDADVRVAAAQRVGDRERRLDVAGGPAPGEDDVHRGVTDRAGATRGPRASVATDARRAEGLGRAGLGAGEGHQHAERHAVVMSSAEPP